MHGDVVARSHGAHAIKDAFCAGVAGDGVNHHICAWESAIDGFSGFADDFAGVLEGVTSWQCEREVGKVRCAGAAHARLFDSEYAIYSSCCVNHPPAGYGGGVV